MCFEGAWDAGFAGYLFEKHKLFGIPPAQDLLIKSDSEVRCAMTQDMKKWVVYSPCSQSVLLKISPQEYPDVLGVELPQRKIFYPRLISQDGILRVGLPPFNSDFLLLGTC